MNVVAIGQVSCDNENGIKAGVKTSAVSASLLEESWYRYAIMLLSARNSSHLLDSKHKNMRLRKTAKRDY
jgi:hypothetical protein